MARLQNLGEIVHYKQKAAGPAFFDTPSQRRSDYMRQAFTARTLIAGAFAALLPLHGAVAQEAASSAETAAAPALVVELNTLQKSERGCRFTFVATNQLGAELSKAAFELVLFDRQGKVSRLTVVDFRDLPEGKTKVRQFDFSGLDCTGIGRVLINDATECAGPGLDPKACIQNLTTRTGTEVTFGV